MMPCSKCWGMIVTLFLWVGPAAAVPIATSGYQLSTLVTPGIATGGVAAVGESLFVGVGSYGAGAQSVARIDSGGTTLIAQGFGSLSGMTYDAAGDRLLVGDNFAFGGSLGSAATADNLYAIPSPLSHAGTPFQAQNLEVLLPTGATLPLPGMADVTLDPRDPTGQSLFVTDSSESFPPNGLLLSVDTATQTAIPLVSGLGYAAGVAATATAVFFGEVDAATFQGQISRLDLTPGGGSSVLVSGLAGQADLFLASDGNLLATASAYGGASEVLRINPNTGAILETVASGFDFATALTESEGSIYVLEGGSTAGSKIYRFSPIPEPASILMLGLGFGWLSRLGRCNRSPGFEGSDA